MRVSGTTKIQREHSLPLVFYCVIPTIHSNTAYSSTRDFKRTVTKMVGWESKVPCLLFPLFQIRRPEKELLGVSKLPIRPFYI